MPASGTGARDRGSGEPVDLVDVQRGLQQRGLLGMELVVSDDHRRLRQTIGDALPEPRGRGVSCISRTTRRTTRRIAPTNTANKGYLGCTRPSFFKSNREQHFRVDRKSCNQRHYIANAFGQPKNFRRVATRYHGRGEAARLRLPLRCRRMVDCVRP